MSKAMRGAITILAFLLIVSVGVAVYALLQRQSLDQQNQNLQSQISEEQTKQTQLQTKLTRVQKDLEKTQQDFKDRLDQAVKEKDELQRTSEDLKSKSDDLNNQVSQLSEERDDWKSRVDTLRKERDNLMEKLKNPKVKIVYRDRPADAQPATAIQQTSAPAVTTNQGDQYWAQILKEKAALQLDLQKVKADLDQSAIQVVELRKQTAELQLELKNLGDAKQEAEHQIQLNQQEYERKLRYSEELANSISVEVARARNDQKTANDRAEQLKRDNMDMQSKIKELNTTKLALERTIAQINVDKVRMEKKLAETEGTIQGRINEIWQIKENLEKKISSLPATPSEVELPPIIVNAAAANQAAAVNAAANAVTAAAPPVVPFMPPAGPKSQGSIISINEPNNFAIVDLGEMDGSQVGRPLTVFRSDKPIGNLEVIQVRKDISAADIKQNSMKLKVGDIVRY